MTMRFLQKVAFSPQDAPEKTWHFVHTLGDRSTRSKMQERVVASRSSDVWWNSETSQLPGSFASLIQIYSDKTAISLQQKGLSPNTALVVWLNATKRKKKLLADHE